MPNGNRISYKEVANNIKKLVFDSDKTIIVEETELSSGINVYPKDGETIPCVHWVGKIVDTYGLNSYITIMNGEPVMHIF